MFVHQFWWRTFKNEIYLLQSARATVPLVKMMQFARTTVVSIHAFVGKDTQDSFVKQKV